MMRMRTTSNTKKCSILNRGTQNLRHESEIMPSLRLKHAGLKQSKLYVEMAKMREPVVRYGEGLAAPKNGQVGASIPRACKRKEHDLRIATESVYHVRASCEVGAGPARDTEKEGRLLTHQVDYDWV